MAERNHLRTDAATDVRQFLTFRSAEKVYAVPAEQVREILLPVPLAKVPLSPLALLGLANLRGVVLPVASLAILLGRRDEHGSPLQRIIVLEGRAGFGLLVDEILALTRVRPAELVEREAQLSAEPGEVVLGAFSTPESVGSARILDIQKMLSQSLGASTPPRAGEIRARTPLERVASIDHNSLETFITFKVAEQEFGLPLTCVQEVLPSADSSTPVPRADVAVLGLTTLRSSLLPLLSMRALLGFDGDAGRSMTIVVSVAGVSVGLAVDVIMDIVRADPSALEPVPLAIATRSTGETSLQSVLKLDNGSRLIALISPDKLFREDIMTRLKAASVSAARDESIGSANRDEHVFLVFKLGGQEFGLPISAVEEVARMPEEITRVPKAPDFLKGVVNLRGTVLPIIDQRRRFDYPPSDRSEIQRLVVARAGTAVAGFIVDSVSEVLRVSSDAIEAPPEAGASASVLVGVINLEAQARMVLLLDPSQLLSRTEQGLLDALGRVQEAQAAVDQGSDR